MLCVFVIPNFCLGILLYHLGNWDFPLRVLIGYLRCFGSRVNSMCYFGAEFAM